LRQGLAIGIGWPQKLLLSCLSLSSAEITGIYHLALPETCYFCCSLNNHFLNFPHPGKRPGMCGSVFGGDSTESI
jgi:hypothetical protein